MEICRLSLLQESKNMLKIKDDVDLKELEKFGFKETKNKEWVYLEHKTTYFYRDDKRKLKKEVCCELIKIDRYRDIVINADIKQFPKEQIYGYGSNIIDLNILYDLIKADLVEKVGE